MPVRLEQLAQLASSFFEVVALLIILAGFVLAVWRSVTRLRSGGGAAAYDVLRTSFGRSVLLGLEVLVAADLIRTVSVSPTLSGLAVLAGLVGIRTFLSWSFEVEIDGRWPWQRAREGRSAETTAR